MTRGWGGSGGAPSLILEGPVVGRGTSQEQSFSLKSNPHHIAVANNLSYTFFPTLRAKWKMQALSDHKGHNAYSTIKKITL